MMSTGPEDDRSRRDDIVAGEYVLGVLSAKDRVSVEARMASDSAFARKIARWQEQLAPVNDDYAEVTPPADVFSKLEKRLFESAPAAKTSLWSSLIFWRSLTLASLALVAAMGLLEFGLFIPEQTARPLVAQLISESGNLNLVALYDSQSGIVRLTPAAAGKPEEKSLELWLIDGNNPAISLGVLPSTGAGEVNVPPAIRSKITDGMVLAVSLEPFGGSPTGKATGPVIAVGKAQHL
jgi:anti-sigma-K factor RskA